MTRIVFAEKEIGTIRKYNNDDDSTYISGNIYLSKIDSMYYRDSYDGSMIIIHCCSVMYGLYIKNRDDRQKLFNYLTKVEERNSKIEETLS